MSTTPVRAGDTVVDLGAGAGALTRPLLLTGARVLAVESHRGRAERLRRDLAEPPWAATSWSVLTLDVLDFTYPGHPVRVVANPPFALAASILSAAVASPSVRSLDLVLPSWLVRRHLADDRRRRGFEAAAGLPIPASAFHPPAPLPCAVLQLRRPGRRRR